MANTKMIIWCSTNNHVLEMKEANRNMLQQKRLWMNEDLSIGAILIDVCLRPNFTFLKCVSLRQKH